MVQTTTAQTTQPSSTNPRQPSPSHRAAADEAGKKPIVSAFNWVPDFARGQVRDLRVRWALEEIGQPYETALLDATRPRGPDYTGWQPFGQVPALRIGGMEMFESGAILLFLGETEEHLLPAEPQARWQAVSWLLAALNSVEPYLAELADVTLFHGEEEWSDKAFAAMRPAAEKRLEQLATALAGRDWLAGRFSIADIAMVTVLGITEGMDLLAPHDNLLAYRARGMARPAFQRALAAQLADFADEPPHESAPAPRQETPQQGE